MSKGTKAPCLDCRERRVGCHDPNVCQAWAEYAAQAKAVQKETEHRRAVQGQLHAYRVELHDRLERRSRYGY